MEEVSPSPPSRVAASQSTHFSPSNSAHKKQTGQATGILSNETPLEMSWPTKRLEHNVMISKWGLDFYMERKLETPVRSAIGGFKRKKLPNSSINVKYIPFYCFIGSLETAELI